MDDTRRNTGIDDDQQVSLYADPKSAVYAVVRQFSLDCAKTYVGEPEGFTCLDMLDRAGDAAERFGDEYRQKILRGDFLCPWCRLLLARRHRKVLPDARRSTATGSHDYYGTRLLLGPDDAPDQPPPAATRPPNPPDPDFERRKHA